MTFGLPNSLFDLRVTQFPISTSGPPTLSDSQFKPSGYNLANISHFPACRFQLSRPSGYKFIKYLSFSNLRVTSLSMTIIFNQNPAFELVGHQILLSSWSNKKKILLSSWSGHQILLSSWSVNQILLSSWFNQNPAFWSVNPNPAF